MRSPYILARLISTSQLRCSFQQQKQAIYSDYKSGNDAFLSVGRLAALHFNPRPSGKKKIPTASDGNSRKEK